MHHHTITATHATLKVVKLQVSLMEEVEGRVFRFSEWSAGWNCYVEPLVSHEVGTVCWF